MTAEEFRRSVIHEIDEMLYGNGLVNYGIRPDELQASINLAGAKLLAEEMGIPFLPLLSEIIGVCITTIDDGSPLPTFRISGSACASP